MALNIKNPEVERLATEVAELAHETKTQAIGKALEERKLRLTGAGKSSEERFQEAMEYMERNVWSKLPPSVRGKRTTKKEREEALGYGPDGV